MHGGNGAIYADNPGADRATIGKLFALHKRMGLKRRLDLWVWHVFDVYLALGPNDDRLVFGRAHPLQLLQGCLPMVVEKVQAQFAAYTAEEQAKELYPQQEVAP